MSVDDRMREFWEFMLERELIRQRRLHGLPREEWTQDPIFREYSFTNVKREHDRMTTLLWREFYEPSCRPNEDSPISVGHPSPTTLLNAAIFRLTGTIESARAMGWSVEWERRRFELTIGARVADGLPTFTPAYIIPNMGRAEEKFYVVADVIDGIWARAQYVLHDENGERERRWERVCDRLTECYGIGQFLAKEILLDYILATGWTPDDWETWTPVGPGARRGAGWILTGEIDEVPEDLALNVCRQIYSQRDGVIRYTSELLLERWPKDFFDRVGGSTHRFELPRLSLTDIQFQLCEVAKYMKVRLGVGKPKRKFRPTIDDVTKRKG